MLGLQLNTNVTLRSDKVLRFFFTSYGLYLISHFICQKAIYSSLLFYLSVVPSLIYYFYNSKNQLKQISRENKLLMFLLLYILIHSFVMINEMEPKLAFKGIRNIIATFLFLLSTLLFFHKSTDQTNKALFLALTITSGALAVASIFVHIYSGNIRLVPLGFAHHEILGASLYATCGIIALYLSFTSTFHLTKALFLIVYIIILLMVMMTNSRGPILAYLACSGLGILLFSQRLRRVIIISALITLFLAGIIALVPQIKEIAVSYLTHFFERGTSYRLVLWQLTLDRIFEQPLLGYGIRNVFESDVPGGHSPHNLYLSTAYYFGLPALGILIGVIVKAMVNILKGFSRGNYSALLFVLLMHALFSVITDHGQLARGNTPIWLIFWLPVCMCLVYKNDRSAKI